MPKTPSSAVKPANTIFNYFVKTPPASSSLLSTEREPKHKAILKPNFQFTVGDLVWGKLEGHPWWPCLVFKRPKDGVIYRNENSHQVIHVQFFGETPCRGWVKDKFVKPFNGSASKECQRGGMYFSSDPDWKVALKQAEDALKSDKEERLKLIMTEASSDDEDEIGEMEVDGDDDDVLVFSDGNKVDKENKSPPGLKTSKCSRKSMREPQNKRRRVIESDDEADISLEDSYQPGEEGSSESSSSDEGLSDEEVEEDSDGVSGNGGEDESPKNRKRERNGTLKSGKQLESRPSEGVVRRDPMKKKVQGVSKTKDESPEESLLSPHVSQGISTSTKLKLSAYSASSVSKEASSVSSTSAPLCDVDDDRTFPHTTFKFLQPDKIKDNQRRSPDDPDYDPRTLFVPDDFLLKQTPAMKQWWVLKSQHFDTILFFKMGKFYELFHMDAVIGVNELGLLFMKGDHAHCGFPEISYGRFSDLLIQKGYKVARVEQTETPEQMQERCKQTKSTKFDKVVKREICSIQSRGTKKSSFIDGDCCTKDHNFLLSISEKVDGSESLYGICFVDVMIGTFHVGQFKDDRHGSRLRTLISHFPPSQVLYEKGKLSERIRNMFNSCLSNAMKEGLKSGLEFWDGAKTLKVLSESEYFVDEQDRESGLKWPEAFKEMVSKDDSLGLTPSGDFVIGLSALGAVVWYLRLCLMDDELLSLKSFEIYVPVDVEPGCASMPSSCDMQVTKNSISMRNKRMILDGVTLVNLDVLINSNTGTSEGTLLQKLDSCKTPFGKRLFKQWLCSPLCSPDSINDRLDAVEDIMSTADLMSQVSVTMSKMPDLERLLNKIHTLSSFRRSKNHPDSRAVFFEDVTYNKRKIVDFINCLEGFKMAREVVEMLEDVATSFKSNLLKKCILLKEKDGMFPDLTKQLEFFEASFDHQKAKSMGVIRPVKGVNAEYDDALSDIHSFEGKLNECLEQLKKHLNCRTLTFFGTAKNRYQVEVPENLCRKVPDKYDLISQRKGFKRYQSPEMKSLFVELMDAEDRRDAAQKDTMRRVFEQFDKHRVLWLEALQCLSVLDILMSLAAYSNQSGWSMCRPELIPRGGKPFLEIKNGCHPCVERSSGNDFIPNDTIIGTSADSCSARVLLLTGPNMGGKSTLMRQVGLICLLAQLGCYVPAEECSLTPVDRIFTRLGASDHIMSGESTFFVELSETSCVLKHATKDSLVLLDELGRGTATYDGNAIASAVLQELTDSIQCRTIFSTHYHSIVERFSSNQHVFLGHMACMVENEDGDDPCQETITFLFKLASGNCPKSYGFNAAKLAGISPQVIREAHLKAKEFEESTRFINLFRNLLTIKRDESTKLRSLIGQIN